MAEPQSVVQIAPIATQEPQLATGAKQDPPPPPPAKNNHPGWASNEGSTLIVVATLITTLTYQIGSNPPGGFWQDDNGHEAGAPIMRDKHRRRYWLFMTAAWVGFGDSMLLTLWLLTGVPAGSRRVRWSFIVAYSSLQLTYITAMHGTSLIMDLATWAGIMLFLALVVGFEKHERRKLGSHCFSFVCDRRSEN